VAGRAQRLTGGREQIPFARQPLQFVRTALAEPQSRARDEIGHNSRNQHLVRRGLRHDAGRRVDGYAPNVAAPHLDLASMQTSAYRQADLTRGTAERQRAPDRTTGPVEGGEHAVPGALHQIASMPVDELTRKRVVLVEATTPPLVAYFGRLPRGVDDVREHDRRENALEIGVARFAMARHELLDVADQRLGVAGPECVISRRILDVLRPGYFRRHLTAQRYRHLGVGRPMQDQGRGADIRKNGIHVYPGGWKLCRT
jgi:hypothetical protein